MPTSVPDNEQAPLSASRETGAVVSVSMGSDSMEIREGLVHPHSCRCGAFLQVLSAKSLSAEKGSWSKAEWVRVAGPESLRVMETTRIAVPAESKNPWVGSSRSPDDLMVRLRRLYHLKESMHSERVSPAAS